MKENNSYNKLFTIVLSVCVCLVLLGMTAVILAGLWQVITWLLGV